MVPVKSIQPFHDHPFHLYEGERLEDMIASVKEHGMLNPVIVQKLDTGYEMLSGHNRWNAAKLAGIKEIPAIVKTDLSEEEAYVYVIETNLMQRSFSDLAISEKAAVLKERYGAKWQRERRKFLESNPFCVKCYEEGHITMATVVDHIIPHRGDQKLFWDRSNWQPLCEHHHNVKTMTEDRFKEYRF